MKESRCRAKITPPSPYGIVPRKRLFGLMDKCREASVTWITGPGGSGKTSLAASYIDFRKLPCIWYQVDPGDADIATFFYYMGLAANKASRRSRKRLPLLTPEYMPDVSLFCRRYCEELYGRLDSPFVIVLDNYQEVPAESDFHEMVNICLSSVPEGIHVFVLSRNDPPQAFIKLRAGGKIKVLGWKDIRFSEKESREVVRLNENRKLDAKTLSLLHRRTEGWVAGLILLLESSRSKDIDYQLLGKLKSDEIFEYFACEIFQKTDFETRKFLLKTAFLPSMTVRMAESLTNLKAAGQLLAGLERKNYFIEKHLKTDPVYSYHPLFGEFLKSRAKDIFSRDELADVQRSAASVLMKSGHVEDAAALLLDARDWSGFVPFVLGNAQSLMAQGRSKTLQEWLANIPLQIAEHSPWLLFWTGVCKLSSHPAEARGWFEQAFHLFNTSGDEAGALMSWSGAVDTFFLEFADFRPLDGWIGWLDERIRKGVPFPSPEVEARVAASMTGALVWRMPDHPDMKRWLRSVLSLSEQYLGTDARMKAFLDITLYYLWMGEFVECNMMVDEMRKMAISRSASPLMLIAVKHAEALFFLSSVECSAKVVASVNEGLDISRQTGVHLLDLHLLAHGVHAALNARDAEMACNYLQKMEKFPGSHNVVRSSLFFFLSACTSMLLENAPRAVVFAKKSVQLIEETGIAIPEAFNRVMAAIALCETGDMAGADEQLEKIRGIAVRTGSSYLKYLYHTAKAHIAFTKKENGPGLEALAAAMTLGRQKDYMTVLNFLRPGDMGRLCRKALDAGIETDYVLQMIRRLDLLPDVAPEEAEHWPWDIRIYTLGHFEILKDGAPLEYPVKAPRKIISLLKAIIASGSKGACEEQLADILWPDADADTAHQALNTSLHRLRQMLGNDRAVLLREGCVKLDPRYCWVDSLTFEALLGRAEKMLKRAHVRPAGCDIMRDALGTMERAVMLYRGAFLEDVAGPWVLSFRERLRSKFLRSVQRLGEEHEKNGRYDSAVEYYRKGLEVDDLAEELYLRIMKCLHASGRRAEAIEVYNRCRTILLSGLGVGPAPGTEAFFKALSSHSLQPKDDK